MQYQFKRGDKTISIESNTFPKLKDIEQQFAITETTQAGPTNQETNPSFQKLLQYDEKAKKIRPVGRKNPDGSISTVLFSTMEVDNKFFVVPTLFPKSNNPTTEFDDWKELKGMDAFNEAKKRNELFEFDSPEEAESFSRGSWKNQTSPLELRQIKPPEKYKTWIDQAFIQPFASLNVGVNVAGGNITQALENYATYLSENVPIPGMTKGNLFQELTNYFNKNAETWRSKGIPDDEGFSSNVAKALYEGSGQVLVDLPLISSMGKWGLAKFSAGMGGADAIGKDGSLVGGLAKGAVEGAALHLTLQATRVMPRIYGEAAGGGVFGGLTLVDELQKSEGDVDWANVTAQTLLGIGMTLNGKRIPQKDFIEGIKTNFKQGQKDFVNFTSKAGISKENGLRLFKELKNNQKKLSDSLYNKFPNILTKPSNEKRKPKILEEGGFPKTESVQVDNTKVKNIIRVNEKWSGSINKEKQKNLSEESKKLQDDAANLVPKTIVSWDKTGEISNRYFQDLKKVNQIIEKGKKGAGLNTAELNALRQINMDALTRLAEIGKNKPKPEFDMLFNQYRDNIFTAITNATSEAGRSLNILKQTTSANALAKSIIKLERSLNERELKEFKNLDTSNPAAIKRFHERLGNPKLQDYFWDFWYNNMLSGIPTHVVNTASNTVWSMQNIAQRGFSGAIDKYISKFTGKKRAIFMDEVLPLMAGVKKSFGLGARRALETLKTGQTPLEINTKWSMEMGSASSAFERSPNKLVRKIAPFFSAPTRALKAMDVWANSIAFDMQIHALARRFANQRGLIGEERNSFEIEFRKNPPEKAISDAKEFAKYSTFTDDPGAFTKGISQVLSQFGGAPRIIIPFVGTVGNIFKRGFELTPGIGAFTRRKGDTFAEVTAKQLTGVGIAATVYGLWKDDKITGGVPKSEAERDAFYRQGKLPYSIKVDDTYYSFRRFEPFNVPISQAISAFEEFEKGLLDEATMTEIMTNLVGNFVDNAIDGSYTEGLQNVFVPYKRERFVGRSLTNLVPHASFWRSFARATEAATEGEVVYKETKDILDALSNSIPFGDKIGNPPVKIDVFGEPVIIEGGVLRQWLPFKWQKETDDVVEIELDRLGVYPGLPSNKFKDGKVEYEMTQEEYKDYAIKTGQTIKKVLDKLMLKEKYKKLDDDSKLIVINKSIDTIRPLIRNTIKEIIKARRSQSP